jgi:hypothetical protein
MPLGRGAPKIIVAWQYPDGETESISGYGELTVQRRQDRIDGAGFGVRYNHILPGAVHMTTTIEWTRWHQGAHPQDEEIEPPQREIER